MDPKKKPEQVDPISNLPPGMAAGIAKVNGLPNGPGPVGPGSGAAAQPKTFHSPAQPNVQEITGKPGVQPPAPAGPTLRQPFATITPMAASAPAAPTLARKGGAFSTAVDPADGGIKGEYGAGAKAIGNAIGGFFGGLRAKQDQAHANAVAANPALGQTYAQTQAAPTAPTLTRAAPPAAPAKPVAAVSPTVIPPVAKAQGAAATPAATVAAAVPTQPTLKPGDVNTYTGTNGVTRAVPGMTAQPGTAPTPTVPIAAATDVVAPTLSRPGVPVANVQSDRSIIKNPDEDQRRLEIALSGATFGAARNRGQRALQGAMVNGLFEQDAQKRGLEAADAQAALDANVSLAQTGAEQTGENYRSELAEGNENARTSATLKRQADAEANGVQQVLAGSDGTASLLRGNGSLTQLTGADGQPFRQQDKTGSITDRDVFNAYNEQLKALNENALLRPEERSQQIQQLQARPEFAAMLQKVQGTGGASPPAGAIEKLQADPTLAAAFDAKYGTGASTRYLTR